MCESDEWKSAYILNQQNVPSHPPTLNELQRLVAWLGGFLGRKVDGELDVKPSGWGHGSASGSSYLESGSTRNVRLRGVVFNENYAIHRPNRLKNSSNFLFFPVNSIKLSCQPKESATMLEYHPRASFASLERYFSSAPSGLVPFAFAICAILPSLTSYIVATEMPYSGARRL